MSRIINLANILKFLLLIIIFRISLLPLSDPDMFFHIKNGENIFYNGIKQLDIYTMHNNLTYIQHEWLSDIIFNFIYSINGFFSLWIFKIIMTFIIFICLYYLNKQFYTNKALIFCVSALTTISLTPFITIRPQIFSFLVFIFEVILLEKYIKSQKSIYLMFIPILAVILINIHGAASALFFIFLLLYFVISIFYFEFSNKLYLKATKDFRQAVSILAISVISLLSMLINPNGYKTLIYVFDVLGNSSISQRITELQALTIRDGYGIIVFGLLFIMILTTFAVNNKITLKQLLFVFGLFYMALSHIRFSGYFIIFSLPLYCEYLEQNNVTISKNVGKFLSIAIITFFVILIPSMFLNYNVKYIDLVKYPVKSANIIKKEQNVRLFNAFNYGHFLIYNDIEPFIDGRAEMFTKKVNNTDVYDDYVELCYNSIYPEEIIRKYNFNYFLVSKNFMITSYLTNSSKYEKLIEENDAILFRRIDK